MAKLRQIHLCLEFLLDFCPSIKVPAGFSSSFSVLFAVIRSRGAVASPLNQNFQLILSRLVIMGSKQKETRDLKKVDEEQENSRQLEDHSGSDNEDKPEGNKEEGVSNDNGEIENMLFRTSPKIFFSL
ncbi:hypothetical protein AAHA92_33873 [Salvia divinorum]|uniref:Uncharacterized protein n=1 Tax=Salvia divinorum TaxID=28513 RepID=A0ABD1FK97_SALDI